MDYVKLLYRHTEAGKGYRPAQLREVLERAIKEFKNNTLFLSVFYHNEGDTFPLCFDERRTDFTCAPQSE